MNDTISPIFYVEDRGIGENAMGLNPGLPGSDIAVGELG